MDAKRPDVRVDDAPEEADGVVTERDRANERTATGRIRATVGKLLDALRR